MSRGAPLCEQNYYDIHIATSCNPHMKMMASNGFTFCTLGQSSWGVCWLHPGHVSPALPHPQGESEASPPARGPQLSREREHHQPLTRAASTLKHLLCRPTYLASRSGILLSSQRTPYVGLLDFRPAKDTSRCEVRGSKASYTCWEF